MKRTRQQIREAGMLDLRKEAAFRDCQIRVSPDCGGSTVLCHWRQSGISGMGLKAPDIFGAWGCSACHDLVDHAAEADYALRLDFAQAVFRTQYQLWKEEKIQW